jgi:hypothetical protein
MNPRYVERKIAHLTREITEIDDYFYRVNEKEDRYLYAGMLERKRDDMVRSAVLQIHTAIEDNLNSLIICHFMGVGPEHRKTKLRTNSGRALQKMLFGGGSIGFDMKLNFAMALGILNPTVKQRLTLLNTLRNKCSHNWILNLPQRRGRRPREKKLPFLSYKGHDLHKVAVFEDFAAEYGPIYYKLFLKLHG